MHLFILGTVIIVLLPSKSSLACTFAVTSSVLCMLHTTFNVWKHNAPAFVLESFSVMGMANYMNYVHMVTSTYVPSYMIGMFMGYFIVEKRSLIRFTSHSDARFKTFFLFLLLILMGFLMASTAIFDIPHSFTPLVVILCRIVCSLFLAVGVLLYIAYNASRKEEKLANGAQSSGDESDKLKGREKKQPINFLTGINRLSTPLFFVNYVVIRTLFFRQRGTYDTAVLPVVRQSSMCSIC